MSHELHKLLHVHRQICIVLCLQTRNVCYVMTFLSFDGSVCMSPGGAGSRKSQMSIVSSSEPLTIWKSSNCRLNTRSECSCEKQVRIISQGQATQFSPTAVPGIQCRRIVRKHSPSWDPLKVHYTGSFSRLVGLDEH